MTIDTLIPLPSPSTSVFASRLRWDFSRRSYAADRQYCRAGIGDTPCITDIELEVEGNPRNGYRAYVLYRQQRGSSIQQATLTADGQQCIFSNMAAGQTAASRCAELLRRGTPIYEATNCAAGLPTAASPVAA